MLQDARVRQRIATRLHQAKLRRLERHLPEGARLDAGGWIVTSGIDPREFHERLQHSYRFWRLRRRWNDTIRPVRLSNVRSYWSAARSRVARARHGVGREDMWGLGRYLCGVAARGLRILAEDFEPRPADLALEDWLGALEDHARALQTWSESDDDGTPSHDGAPDPVIVLRRAQGALCWIGQHLDALPAHSPDPASGCRVAVAAVIQRGRHGIADRDAAHLDRYLSIVAARGLSAIADHGRGYPMSRVDEHDWHAELRRAAAALWVQPARRATEDDRRRHTAEAGQAWRWIADNLNDLRD